MTARHLYRFGPYRLDAGDRLLYKEGELVGLPPKVFDTLLLLVASDGRVLTKDEMMKHLWPDTFVEEGTLTQYISVLRKALGEGGIWIENLPRRGYRFTAPVEELSDEIAELRIEEHTRSRTVIEEETVTGQGRLRRIGVAAAAENENPYARAFLANTYAQLGDRKRALEHLDRSLAHDPHHPLFLFFGTRTR